LGYLARHLATCLACRSKYDAVTAEGRLTEGLAFDLSEASGLWSEHPQYEEKVDYVNNALDAEEREIVNDHLVRCVECREAFSAFAASRVDDEAEFVVRFPGFDHTNRGNLLDQKRYRNLKSGRLRAAAVILFVATGSLLVYWLLGTDRDAHVQKPKGQVVERMTAPGPSSLARPVARDTINSQVRPQSRTRTDRSLNDELHKATNQGQLSSSSGLASLPELDRSYVESVLLAGDLARPSNLEALGSSSGLLRSTPERKVAVVVLPAHEVIRDTRPKFRWSQIPGASSYQVSVADSKGWEIAKSPSLRSGILQWKPPVTLRRGEAYSWVLTATLDGRKVSHPSPTESENRFSIVSTHVFEELRKIEIVLGPNSPLALGIIYAREGLISSAEASFVEASKRGQVERRKALDLLAKVRAWR
jgi:hypothetical protein